MTAVDIDEAKLRLPELVSAVQGGDEVVIVEDGKPLARLVPVEMAQAPRVAGLYQGAMWVSDDFDEPLPDDFWTGST